MKKNILLIVLAFSFVTAGAQTVERGNKHRLFASYGLNRTAYDLSTLELKGGAYDFNMQHFDANDGHTEIDLAKFNGELGFYFWDNVSISVGYDNMSYKMFHNKLVKINGTIDTGAYAATYYANQGDVIRSTTDFLSYEYSKLSYINLNIAINDDFWVSKNGKLAWSYYFGVGGGVLMNETKVGLFGGTAVTTDNGMSGWGGNASFGTRFHLGPVFLQMGAKTGYMELTDVAVDAASGLGSHNFIFASAIGSLGLSIRF